MDVIISKTDSINRCLKRINEEYAGNLENIKDYTKQDSIVLNLQRACELSIDIANYIIAKNNYETPKTSRDAFEILYDNKIIDENISERLKKMIGFRNIAVHDYKKLDVEIIKNIIVNNLVDFENFIKQIFENVNKNNS